MRPSIHTRGLIAGLILTTTIGSAADPSGPVGHFAPVGRFKPSGEVEAITSTADGKLLIYTNPGDKEIAFLDISDPAFPQETFAIPVDGTPTSVAVHGRWAIAVVAHPYDSVANQHAGDAVVIDLKNPAGPSIERVIPLGGQPDSIAISPNGRYAGITVENERVPDGPLGVTPAGFVAILDTTGNPSRWQLRTVSLTGLATVAPNDPEPEYIDINRANQAAVTLQENNHVAIIDLRSGTVISHFSAGQVASQPADLTNNGVISFTESLTANREPDAIAWTPDGNVVIANEGDLTSRAGGRNFTIFTPTGEIVFDPSSAIEMLAAQAGLYRDNRSGARGAEFNTVRIAKYGNRTYLFASSEKMDFVAVYRLGRDESQPEFIQFLQTGDEPEGMVAIPKKRLLVTGNEDDDTIDIFVGERGSPNP
jgi:hypothetical protein